MVSNSAPYPSPPFKVLIKFPVAVFHCSSKHVAPSELLSCFQCRYLTVLQNDASALKYVVLEYMWWNKQPKAFEYEQTMMNNSCDGYKNYCI